MGLIREQLDLAEEDYYEDETWDGKRKHRTEETVYEEIKEKREWLRAWKKDKKALLKMTKENQSLDGIMDWNVNWESLQQEDGVAELLINAGMRRSELINLQWNDVDFCNRLIYVQANRTTGFHPKGYKPRSIPIGKELERVLMDLPQKGIFVFDSGRNTPAHCPDYYTKEFQNLLYRLGIANANLHTLRHTFASYLVMGGVDIRTVQDLLGHSSVTVTEKYSHLSPVHRQKAAEALRFGNKMETI